MEWFRSHVNLELAVRSPPIDLGYVVCPESKERVNVR